MKTLPKPETSIHIYSIGRERSLSNCYLLWFTKIRSQEAETTAASVPCIWRTLNAIVGAASNCLIYDKMFHSIALPCFFHALICTWFINCLPLKEWIPWNTNLTFLFWYIWQPQKTNMAASFCRLLFLSTWDWGQREERKGRKTERKTISFMPLSASHL